MKPRRPFSIQDPDTFEHLALKTFQRQYEANPVYREYCDHLRIRPGSISDASRIPHLPIQFFKQRKVYCGEAEPEIIFSSSGTTGQITSKHYVSDLAIYEESFRRGFELFYGPVTDYRVLALLPSYLERQGSSLVYMAEDLIKASGHEESGFYLHDLQKLSEQLRSLEAGGKKTLLIGVSFALLDLAEKFPLNLEHTIVMETGGMKGRRKELVREELHQQLRKGLGVQTIHSEYGMTELLSQAYSQGDGIFHCPPWMKVYSRDPEDPFCRQEYGRNGGLNITDLANQDSCAFIATQDLGRVYANGSFEVLGRFDHADIRGCNLMVL